MSSLTEPTEAPLSSDTDIASKIDNTAAVLPGAVATTEPEPDAQTGQLAMVEPASPAESKAQNRIDVSKKEIKTAARFETDKVKPTTPGTTEQPGSQNQEPDKAANAGNDADKKSDADSDSAGKSLASQDPAKQAKFERIPKHMDKSITAAGSLATGAALAKSGSDAAAGAPAAQPGEAATAKDASQDVARSASSLVKQVPKVNSVLELSSSDGRLSIDGIVNSEQVRASILKAGLQAYGMRNLTDRLSVNEAVAPFEWAENASDLIVLIGGPESETTVRVDGESVTLTGQVNELGDKQARALAAQQLFGTRARVDNRLKVVPKSEPTEATELAKAEPTKNAKPAAAAATTSEAPKPKATKPSPPAATVKKPESTQETKKPAATASGEDPSQLAEGGPGQDDKVVMGPRGMPAKFSRGECPRVMTSVRLRFRSAAVEISEDSQAYLDRLKRCFQSRSYVVRGHTDSRGAALNNLILSQERAQAVVDYLISIGVPSNRVSAKGYGESTPVDSNRSERGRARNRRIDFRFNR